MGESAFWNHDHLLADSLGCISFQQSTPSQFTTSLEAKAAAVQGVTAYRTPGNLQTMGPKGNGDAKKKTQEVQFASVLPASKGIFCWVFMGRCFATIVVGIDILIDFIKMHSTTKTHVGPENNSRLKSKFLLGHYCFQVPC